MKLHGLFSASLATAILVSVMGAVVERAEAGTTSGLHIINVTGLATPENGSFRYSYTIDYSQLASPNIQSLAGDPVVGLTLPFFDDASSISDIHSPNSWNYEFVPATAGNWPYSSATDPNANDYDAPGADFDSPSFVLHWFDDATQATALIQPVGVLPGEILGGFDFLSPYGPGDGPVVLTIEVQNGNVSDLADPPLPGTPGSPFATSTAVPEPLTATLGTLALTALGLTAGRRRG